MDDSENAYQMLVRMLEEWGLGSLAPDVLGLLQDGHTQDQVSLLIQDTSAYKQRFVGNEARRKAGLAALSPAEYLSTEASYRRIMESAGMPSGFYDHPDDFASWIGADVSPSEIQSRVSLATDAAATLDDNSKKAFWEYYRVGESDLAAYFLDRERAMPTIQKQARAAQVGAAANRNQLGVNVTLAEQLAGSNVTDADLAGTVGTAARLTQDLGQIASFYGDAYTVNDATNELFFADEQAQKKRERLTDRERATFSGQGGIGKGSLGQQQNF